MKISARNVFDATVEAVRPGVVNSEVDMRLPGGIPLVATVANDSVAELGLHPGKAVIALIKASSVLVMVDGARGRLSARNRLEGQVAGLVDGPVSTEVAIAVNNGPTVHATITRDGATALGLRVGVPAAAIFKAPSVIIGLAS